MTALEKIKNHLDHYLRISKVSDWPNAINGLQVANSGRVKKIGAAVDACEASILRAREEGVSLLIVHHGLFWAGAQPLVSAAYRKIKAALDGDLAIYSAHLPLDVHPVVGNNALLCSALGLKNTKPFFLEKNQFIGLKARCVTTRTQLARRLENAVGGPVKVCPGGAEKIRMIGVVTGGAGGEVHKAAGEGIDTFITGEGPHWSYTAAEDLRINVLYGGHYATETFGVKALAQHLAQRFELPWTFIDHPTGL